MTLEERVRCLAERIAALNPTTEPDKRTAENLVGAVVELSRAVALEAVSTGTGDAWPEAKDAAERIAKGEVPATDRWLYGFHRNGALHRIAACSERLVREAIGVRPGAAAWTALSAALTQAPVTLEQALDALDAEVAAALARERAARRFLARYGIDRP